MTETTAATDVGALLDELDAAREKATPGPWWNESGTVHAPFPFGRNDGKPGGACHPLDAQGGNGRDADADAELAVAAVNAAPGLVAIVREFWDEHDGLTCHDRTADSHNGVRPCPTRVFIAAALTAEAGS